MAYPMAYPTWPRPWPTPCFVPTPDTLSMQSGAVSGLKPQSKNTKCAFCGHKPQSRNSGFWQMHPEIMNEGRIPFSGLVDTPREFLG